METPGSVAKLRAYLRVTNARALAPARVDERRDDLLITNGKLKCTENCKSS